MIHLLIFFFDINLLYSLDDCDIDICTYLDYCIGLQLLITKLNNLFLQYYFYFNKFTIYFTKFCKLNFYFSNFVVYSYRLRDVVNI